MPTSVLEKRPIGDEDPQPVSAQVDPSILPGPKTELLPQYEDSHHVVVNDNEAIDQLVDMFPNVERETIQEYYNMCGKSVERTFNFIGQQMNMYGEDGGIVESEPINEEHEEAEEHRVAPEDVQFNLLAGNQFDPNLISHEERKMIEQALRESAHAEREMYENQRAQIHHRQHPPAQHHPQDVRERNVNRVSESERQMEEIARSEGLHNDRNAAKAIKKNKKSIEQVDKEKGNK